MDEAIDLMGVDPLRREETLRRIGVVRRYLAIAAPTRSDSLRAALELDVAEARFQRMVRAWRTTGEARDMPDATTPTKASTRSLPAEIDETISRTLDAIGHDLPYPELAKAVSDACLMRGFAPPSDTALRLRIDRRRLADPRPEVAPDEVVIGACATHLPILLPNGEAGPAIVTLALLHGPLVIAHRVDPTPSVDALAAVISRSMEAGTKGADQKRVVVQAASSPDRTRLGIAMAAAGLEHLMEFRAIRSPGGSMTRLLAGRLGDLPVRVVAGRRSRMTRVLRHAATKPLRIEDAARQVEEAVSIQNAAAPNLMEPFAIGPPGAADVLMPAWRNLSAAR